MEQRIARDLAALTEDFYRGHAQSFSATRAQAWPGWKRVLGSLEAVAGPSGLVLLDVACGNLRFERFMADTYEGRFVATAVDSCDELAVQALPEMRQAQPQVQPSAGRERARVTFVHADIIAALLDGGREGVVSALGKAYDAVVCFGFFHHVPGADNRAELMRALVQTVRPGGVVAVSLWRFAEHEAGYRKAQARDARALAQLSDRGWDIAAGKLEPGDHLVGWHNKPGVWRYCHSFSDEEAKGLAQASPEIHCIDRFASDGKTGTDNLYLVVQRKEAVGTVQG